MSFTLMVASVFLYAQNSESLPSTALAFNETLGKILKEELSMTAPKVAKANKLFELLTSSIDIL